MQWPNTTTRTSTGTAGEASTNTGMVTAGRRLRAGRPHRRQITGSPSTPMSTTIQPTRHRSWCRQHRGGDAMAPMRASLAHIEKRDARAALAALPPRSISVLITDPPYATVDRRRTNGHLRAWFAASLTWRQIREMLAIARSRMRPDGIAFVMTNSNGLPEAIEAMGKAGFTGVRPITWDKVCPGLGGGLRHQTEFVLVGYLPGSRTLAGVDLVTARAVGPGTSGRYPTEKPADLGRALAKIANIGRGDFVVDPFCGSGALLIGAAERGAKVAGYDVAAAAVKRASGRLTVRAKPAPTTKSPIRTSPTRGRQTKRGSR